MIVHGLERIVGQKKLNENNAIYFLPGLPKLISAII